MYASYGSNFTVKSQKILAKEKYHLLDPINHIFSEDEKKEETKTTNFMDGWEMPSEVQITAWYTPDIPINQGPENYWGLPGLILEINEPELIILCSKVVLNTKGATIPADLLRIPIKLIRRAADSSGPIFTT